MMNRHFLKGKDVFTYEEYRFRKQKRPVLTIVMDGVGYTPNKTGNAVAAADTRDS